MNQNFLKIYNDELRYLRELGGEFAAAYPKVAGRLGLDAFECADPYVERLLEGVSFLAARVHARLDAEFPRFTQHLAGIVCPQLLTPTPSMAIVQFEPEWGHPSLEKGVVVPRHTALNGRLGPHSVTRCEFRTAHEVTLHPLRLNGASYVLSSGALGSVAEDVNDEKAQAILRLRFEVTGEIPLQALDIDALPLYLRGNEGFAECLYEQLLGHVVEMFASSTEPGAVPIRLSKGRISPLGFDDASALLPLTSQTFGGYRVLREYFAFSQRFLFVNIEGLRSALPRCGGASFDVIFLLDEYRPDLFRSVDAANFALFCSPVINLFPRRADRILFDETRFEHPLVVDKTRPLDFEVHSVESVTGYEEGNVPATCFKPFYQARGVGCGDRQNGAYFQLYRRPRQHDVRERELGARSRYLGSEAFIALVDSSENCHRVPLRQLAVDVLCTNRDLPLRLPIGLGATDFTCEAELPVRSVRCLSGPSEPKQMPEEGEALWRFINHLSHNYLSLVDDSSGEGSGEALRALLDIYRATHDSISEHQVLAIKTLVSRPIVRRLPGRGPIAFGRGLELTLTIDESGFDGAGAFLFGKVLESFFASYVSINHFTETVVCSTTRGEIMRWEPRFGLCQVL